MGKKDWLYQNLKSEGYNSSTLIVAIDLGDSTEYYTDKKFFFNNPEYNNNTHTILKRAPRVTESIDIFKRNHKINSVSFSLYNLEDATRVRYTDRHGKTNFFQKKVDIYLITRDAEIPNMSDKNVLKIYTGYIKKFDHNDEEVKFSCEDQTSVRLESKIPAESTSNSEMYLERSRMKPYPITYGWVDYAKTIAKKETTVNDVGIESGVLRISIDSKDVFSYSAYNTLKAPLSRYENSGEGINHYLFLKINDEMVPVTKQYTNHIHPGPTGYASNADTYSSYTQRDYHSVPVDDHLWNGTYWGSKEQYKTNGRFIELVYNPSTYLQAYGAVLCHKDLGATSIKAQYIESPYFGSYNVQDLIIYDSNGENVVLADTEGMDYDFAANGYSPISSDISKKISKNKFYETPGFFIKLNSTDVWLNENLIGYGGKKEWFPFTDQGTPDTHHHYRLWDTTAGQNQNNATSYGVDGAINNHYSGFLKIAIGREAFTFGDVILKVDQGSPDVPFNSTAGYNSWVTYNYNYKFQLKHIRWWNYTASETDSDSYNFKALFVGPYTDHSTEQKPHEYGMRSVFNKISSLRQGEWSDASRNTFKNQQEGRLDNMDSNLNWYQTLSDWAAGITNDQAYPRFENSPHFISAFYPDSDGLITSPEQVIGEGLLIGMDPRFSNGNFYVNANKPQPQMCDLLFKLGDATPRIHFYVKDFLQHDLYVSALGRKVVNPVTGDISNPLCPANQLYDLIVNEGGVDSSEVDAESFKAASNFIYGENRLVYFYDGYNATVAESKGYSFQISKKIRVRNIVNSLCGETPFYSKYGISDSILYLNHIHDYMAEKNGSDFVFDDPEKSTLITNRNIKKIVFTKTPDPDKLIHKVRFEYNYNEASEKYQNYYPENNGTTQNYLQAETVFSANTSIGEEVINALGLDAEDATFKSDFYGSGDFTLEENLNHIKSARTASAFAEWTILMKANQRLKVKLELNNIKYAYLETGDYIWFNELYRKQTAFGIDYTQDYQLFNGQQFFKYFIITKTAKDDRKVVIEAVQMVNTQLGGNLEGFDDWGIGEGDGIVPGCTDPNATNYNPAATTNDGTCSYPSSYYGCTNPDATNYSPSAIFDDNSCVLPASSSSYLTLGPVTEYPYSSLFYDSLEVALYNSFTSDLNNELFTILSDIVYPPEFGSHVGLDGETHNGAYGTTYGTDGTYKLFRNYIMTPHDQYGIPAIWASTDYSGQVRTSINFNALTYDSEGQQTSGGFTDAAVRFYIYNFNSSQWEQLQKNDYNMGAVEEPRGYFYADWFDEGEESLGEGYFHFDLFNEELFMDIINNIVNETDPDEQSELIDHYNTVFGLSNLNKYFKEYNNNPNQTNQWFWDKGYIFLFKLEYEVTSQTFGKQYSMQPFIINAKFRNWIGIDLNQGSYAGNEINFNYNNIYGNLGDANLDGTVNIQDIVAMTQYILSNQSFTSEQSFQADMNSDNTINILDLTAIVAQLLGLESTIEGDYCLPGHLSSCLQNFSGVIMGRFDSPHDLLNFNLGGIGSEAGAAHEILLSERGFQSSNVWPQDNEDTFMPGIELNYTKPWLNTPWVEGMTKGFELRAYHSRYRPVNKKWADYNRPKPFDIPFLHFVIDKGGYVMLNGYWGATSSNGTPMLSMKNYPAWSVDNFHTPPTDADPTGQCLFWDVNDDFKANYSICMIRRSKLVAWGSNLPSNWVTNGTGEEWVNNSPVSWNWYGAGTRIFSWIYPYLTYGNYTIWETGEIRMITYDQANAEDPEYLDSNAPNNFGFYRVAPYINDHSMDLTQFGMEYQWLNEHYIDVVSFKNLLFQGTNQRQDLQIPQGPGGNDSRVTRGYSFVLRDKQRITDG